MTQCAAQSKQSGHQCKRSTAPGKTVCSMHGGKSPSGLAHPRTTHGRHSRDLPTRLAGRYEAAENDPDRLRLDAEINLVDALINERLGALDSGDGPGPWGDLQAVWKRVVAARRSNSISAILAELPALQLVIERGEADSTARREIMELIERRRRLVDSEIKRRIAAQESLTVDQAAHLVHVLGSSVIRNVTDPEARARIARDIGAVFESFR